MSKQLAPRWQDGRGVRQQLHLKSNWHLNSALRTKLSLLIYTLVNVGEETSGMPPKTSSQNESAVVAATKQR